MKTLRVLICEDVPSDAAVLQACLTRQSHEVVGVVDNGQDAVSAVETLKPDVVFMDIQVPVLNGIQATGRIMEASPTAIIMVTADAEPETVEAAVEAGASGYLVKPIHPSQVAPALAVAVRQFEELKTLSGEVNSLKDALEARKTVERAKGILMRLNNLSETEAYHRLQKISRDRRQSLKKTAEQVLAAAEMLS